MSLYFACVHVLEMGGGSLPAEPLLSLSVLGQLHSESDAIQGRLWRRHACQRADAARGHEGRIALVPSPVSTSQLGEP